MTPRTLARWAGSVLLGAVVGVIGTGVHRMARPWGLVMALVMVALAGVVARAWTGWVGLLTTGLGVATAVGVLGSRGPGGDVLVAADVWGYLWYAGALAVLVAAVLPRGWFATEPRAPQGAADPGPTDPGSAVRGT